MWGWGVWRRGGGRVPALARCVRLGTRTRAPRGRTHAASARRRGGACRACCPAQGARCGTREWSCRGCLWLHMRLWRGCGRWCWCRREREGRGCVRLVCSVSPLCACCIRFGFRHRRGIGDLFLSRAHRRRGRGALHRGAPSSRVPACLVRGCVARSSAKPSPSCGGGGWRRCCRRVCGALYHPRLRRSRRHVRSRLLGQSGRVGRGREFTRCAAAPCC